MTATNDKNLILEITANRDRTALAELINKGGVDLNVQDQYGQTAVMIAVQKNSTGTLQVLLNAGADLTVQDYDANTALDHAKLRNNAEAASMIERATLERKMQAIKKSAPKMRKP